MWRYFKSIADVSSSNDYQSQSRSKYTHIHTCTHTHTRTHKYTHSVQENNPHRSNDLFPEIIEIGFSQNKVSRSGRKRSNVLTVNTYNNPAGFRYVGRLSGRRLEAGVLLTYSYIHTYILYIQADSPTALLVTVLCL